MDAQKTIKKYILPKTMTTVALVLAVAAVVLAVLGVGAMKSADTEALEFFPSESKIGTMGYIEVVGISDWLYQYDEDTYYTAMDAEGYLYIVVLSDSQFKNMAPQLEYWNDEDPNAVIPAPVRLEGMVTKVSSDTRSAISEVWQLTTAEYDQYFGTLFLDTTTSTAEAAAAGWFVFALLCGIVAIAFFVVTAQASANAKKCLRRLEELNLTERAARQLANEEYTTVIGKNRAMMSQDFIFGKGTGVVVPYSDIVWCYQLDRKRNMIPVNSLLMVGTMTMNPVGAIDLNRPDKVGVIAEAMDIVAQRNPHALVGYSKEYAAQYKSLRKGN